MYVYTYKIHLHVYYICVCACACVYMYHVSLKLILPACSTESVPGCGYMVCTFKALCAFFMYTVYVCECEQHCMSVCV